MVEIGLCNDVFLVEKFGGIDFGFVIGGDCYDFFFMMYFCFENVKIVVCGCVGCFVV